MLPPDRHLIGHWPLSEDADDHSPVGHRTTAVDVELVEGPAGEYGRAARFNGVSSRLEVVDHPTLHFGTAEVTLAAWMRTDGTVDVVGDILSKFDAEARCGIQLGVITNSGVTSTAQSNYRHLHFGIDRGRLDPAWTDCGRPGNAAKVASLTASRGLLFAGTLELGADERGHLWRYDGGQQWIDLGNPVGCNVVDPVVEFDGALYCGTGRYITAGSALGETRNQTPGGQVFRVDADGRWTFCGHPGADGATPEAQPATGYATGKADHATALTVYHGQLYCTSSHRRGVFRYEGGEDWRHVGLDDRRIITFTIYRDRLYALINGGPVYRYEGGAEWTFCGQPEGATQTYGAVTCAGELYVGTWPQGEVFRFDGNQSWTLLGRVGYEREIMAMALHNGKAYVGALPMASVWRLDGQRFTFLGVLDQASAPLRRVWSMATYQGRLFAGTLPSGRVRAIEAGKMATWDHTFPSGWHHVAAVKESSGLSVYVDGKLVASSGPFHPSDCDLSNDRPLSIGCGAYQHYTGLLRDVRLYNRALEAAEVASLTQD